VISFILISIAPAVVYLTTGPVDGVFDFQQPSAGSTDA
jgi:hypothetical protein